VVVKTRPFAVTLVFAAMPDSPPVARLYASCSATSLGVSEKSTLPCAKPAPGTVA
jgi:hypothetical protein